ncbi:hypothetical protein [Candidatus Frankia nodulisporulans]|uniref:hypothetical protein n=2 Tax=Candidatus Frankia nodulisporulans TaxID=2060052 RepID=UPI001FD164A7|nr:hypothetical protein [Candidatus Frankia nodulisporulans]
MVLSLGLAGCGPTSPSPCGTSGVLSGTTCTYNTVGSDTFTMPTGARWVQITAVGAQGGRYFLAGDAAHGGSPVGDITGRAGGGGGQASGTITGLPAGRVLQVDVAGKGADGTAASRSGGKNNGPSGGQGAVGGFGGSNGGVTGGKGDAGGSEGGTASNNGGNGSGGGGSSDVRIATAGCAALTCGLSDRVLVGAGGGGGGGTGGQGYALPGAGGAGGGASVPSSTAAIRGLPGVAAARPRVGPRVSIPDGTRRRLLPIPPIRVSAGTALTVPRAGAASAVWETRPVWVSTTRPAATPMTRSPAVAPAAVPSPPRR